MVLSAHIPIMYFACVLEPCNHRLLCRSCIAAFQEALLLLVQKLPIALVAGDPDQDILIA